MIEFGKKFTFIVRTTITLALVMDALIIFRIFQIDAQNQKVERVRKHIETDYNLFLEPAYHPTASRLATEKEMLAAEQVTYAKIEPNTPAANKAQANITIMRNNIRKLDDSVQVMQARARRAAKAQPKMSNVESAWEWIATYSGIVLGSVVAPLFVIAFLWQFVEVPAKFRGLQKLHIDWTFIVSIAVKGAYITTFIFQWDRLLELLGSTRACYFAGVYAPSLSIICSMYLFSFERRMLELQTSMTNQPNESIQEEKTNGKIDIIRISQVKDWQALPEPIQDTKADRMEVPQLEAPKELPLPKIEDVVIRVTKGRPRLLPPMWDSVYAAMDIWQDKTFTSAALEAVSESRKLDIWRDIPPPVTKDQTKQWLRMLILNKQNRNGDRAFVVRFLGDPETTAESLRRTCQTAEALATANTRARRLSMIQSDLRAYIQLGTSLVPEMAKAKKPEVAA